jgi:hypothetical protein
MTLPLRTKIIRFVICEIIALVMLIVTATIGIQERNANLRRGEAVTGVNPVVSTLTILSAAAVALLPVIFFGPSRLR